MAAQITSPLELFLDSDGTPLEDGYIYIGTQGLNAETNPITVYWDDAYSISASQPIRTIAGYGSNGGVKSNIFVNSSYSIVIKDKNGVLVFSGDSLTDPEVAVGVADAQLRAWEAEAEALTADSYATQTEDVFVDSYASDGDGTFTATPTADYSALHWAAKASASAASVNLPTITAGTAGKHIRVNSGETGYEFTDVTSGTYTPTVSSTSNVTSSGVFGAHYIRVGDIVRVNVSMTITQTTTATTTSFKLSLPIASNLVGQKSSLIGNGLTYSATGTTSQTVGIDADTTNELANVVTYADTTSAAGMQLSFSYVVA